MDKIKPIVVVIGSFILVAWLSTFSLTPSDKISKPALESGYSAERAMNHVKSIAKAPHYLGMNEHRLVQEYIVSELKNLGLEVTVSNETAFREARFNRSQKMIANVQNITAVLPGKGTSSKSLVISSHYDSDYHTPGAGDSGSAVASMLETARTLVAKKEGYKNDIIFLFTDGEEAGLFGAISYVEQLKNKNDIGFLLNMDARGNSGPVLMFETSANNGKVISELHKAVPSMLASSIFYEIYKMVPQGTDFTIFKAKGIRGATGAIVDGVDNYHTSKDNPENLSLASLQSYGNHIFGVANHFGNLDFSTLSGGGNSVYFNTLGDFMVMHPKSLIWPFVILTFLLFVAVLIFGKRKNEFKIVSVLKSVMLYLGVLVLIPSISYGLWFLIELIHPNYKLLGTSGMYNAYTYFWGIFTLAILLFCVYFQRIGSKINDEAKFLGPIIVLVILMLVVTMLAPTAAYLFYVPLIIILLGKLWSLLKVGNKIIYEKYGFLLGLPAIIIWLPIIIIIFQGLSLSMIGPIMLFLTLLLGMLYPYIMKAINYAPKYFNAGLLVIFLLFLSFGSMTSEFSNERPKPTDLSFFWNLDVKKSGWVYGERKADKWASQFLKNTEFTPPTEIIPTSKTPVLKSYAEVLPGLVNPEIKILLDSIRGDKRILEIMIEPPTNEASVLNLPIKKDGVQEIYVNDKLYTDNHFKERNKDGSQINMIFYNPGSHLKLRFELQKNTLLELPMLFISYKMDFKKWGYTERPKNQFPSPGFYSNAIFIKKTEVL
ncbi:M20/M25/M40 family metallo-hydrolase [Pontimicrobium aquaticum]|uniref:M28 family peptidase n=1 Tax=Pontimicrobium aquaticum TaxID=2565367 RepID=A0A4U0F095_9FLAO|nr:M20/M25/M40 family metallo-hydrolase [Pontimicrobium aquaticum]TJY37787.1 M28 family peptidase [Pontimicrobium aquaticum]